MKANKTKSFFPCLSLLDHTWQPLSYYKKKKSTNNVTNVNRFIELWTVYDLEGMLYSNKDYQNTAEISFWSIPSSMVELSSAKKITNSD